VPTLYGVTGQTTGRGRAPVPTLWGVTGQNQVGTKTRATTGGLPLPKFLPKPVWDQIQANRGAFAPTGLEIPRL